MLIERSHIKQMGHKDTQKVTEWERKPTLKHLKERNAWSLHFNYNMN